MTDTFVLLISLAWRSLWRNSRRTLITLLIVAMGMWAILAFSAFFSAWAQSTRNASLRVLTGSGQIHAAHYLDDPSVDYRMPVPCGELRNRLSRPPITTWAPRVRIPAIVQSEFRTLPVTLLGVIPERERTLSDLPGEVDSGRYLLSQADGSIILGRHLVERLKSRVGKRVIVMTQTAKGHLAERSFEVAGIFGGPVGAQDQYAFTGLGIAQAFADMGADISEVSFVVESDAALATAIPALRAAAPWLDIEDWATITPFAFAMVRIAADNVFVVFVIMFALMAIGIINAQMMAIFERTREFGLLLALGMRARLIVLQVAIESALLIAIGVTAGVILTILTIALFSKGLDLGVLASGAERLGAGRILHLSLEGPSALFMCALIWCLGTAAAMWPAWRAARTDPIEAMSSN